jgi:hypothetical protein
MAQSFFEQVEDALVGFLPRTLRTFSSQRTGRNLKVWYGGDTKEHYEVQVIAPGRRGPELEVGFHAEHRAQARNDAVLSWFKACASEWRRTLGKTVRCGPFVGGQWPAWRRISELWTGANLMSPESAVEAAHRLSLYIRVLEPVRRRRSTDSELSNV